MTKIKPEFGYSAANITADARDADSFGYDGISEMLNAEHMEICVPDPTKEDRETYKLGKGDDWDNGEQGSFEYRDSFVPMMNSLWPVDLAYRRCASEAAALMNEYAGATSLVTIGDDYYIAMTGGGMNLSWHIAAAYVCCGSIPPLNILESLKGSPFRLSDKINREIVRAAREAVRFMRSKAKRLAIDVKETGASLAKKEG